MQIMILLIKTSEKCNSTKTATTKYTSSTGIKFNAKTKNENKQDNITAIKWTTTH